MQSDTPAVAVVGGGICGLTTAVALERRGVQPAVYEAATAYEPVGAGITLQGNAMLVLDRLGLGEAVREAGTTLDDTVIQSPAGDVLKRFDLGGVDRAQFGTDAVVIHRAELQRVLTEALSAPVETGCECVSVDGVTDPTVRFADGRTVDPDVVIGADGIGSAVRDAVVSDVTPREFGSVAYRAVIEVGSDVAPIGREVWGTGRYAGGAPVDAERYYWFATTPEPPTEQPDDSAAAVAALRRRFADYPDPIPAVVASLDPDDVIVTRLGDLPELDRWHRGAVVLAGDAAHAMLPYAGQGAGQGIEDAIALADRLTAEHDLETALAAYEAERKPRADRIRVASRRLGRLATVESTLGCRLRNLVTDHVPERLFRRSREKIIANTSVPGRSGASTTDGAARAVGE